MKRFGLGWFVTVSVLSFRRCCGWPRGVRSGLRGRCDDHAAVRVGFPVPGLIRFRLLLEVYRSGCSLLLEVWFGLGSRVRV